jgi:glycosyltransferase involved in cell wall biosynthesis
MDAGRIRVIKNGIDISPSDANPNESTVRREFGIPLHAPMITVVCRLNRSKGLEFFLDAATTVAERFPAARFVIVGGSIFDPDYRNELQRYLEGLGLADRAFLTGERSDIAAILRESTLSVLPSLSEGFSNSLLEAMASGIPVIATSVGGNPEVVSDCGLLVPPGNALALSEAMIQVLESPERAEQMGKAGRKRAVDHFSLNSTVRQTEDLYASLLEEKSVRIAS